VLKKYINSLMKGEYTRVHWILGMLAHKDHSSFLNEVFGNRELFAQHIVTVPVKPNVAWLTSTSAAGLAKNLLHRFDIEQLAKGEQQGGVIVSQAKSVEEALDASVSLESQTLVVLCGSLVSILCLFVFVFVFVLFFYRIRNDFFFLAFMWSSISTAG
jgi:folylpolyglutamate synthase/dihydropteroate synthase